MSESREIKVIQYGEGNFLRAFVDYMIDVANGQGLFQGDVAIVKPIPAGNLEAYRRQENRYHVCLRGYLGGQTVDSLRMVTCIQKILDSYTQYTDYMALAKLPSIEFVVSNTTEAGIVFTPEGQITDEPPNTFPGKLTQFLYRRYLHFGGATGAGLIMLPVELIEDNGKKLRECVLQYIEFWELEDGFRSWVESACTFCSTLVDRIVTGYPREGAEDIQKLLDFPDDLLDVAEPFGLWVIESERDISDRLPLDKAGQPVIFTNDYRPYRERKVRILNGAHTSTVLAGYLCGLDLVGDCMADPTVYGFMEQTLLEEIVPVVPMPKEEAESFARAVTERFRNPFIRHECLSIALNSVSKWKTRVLPSLKDFLEANGSLPRRLTFSLAALLEFYTVCAEKGNSVFGCRNEEPYPLRDDAQVIEFFREYSRRDAYTYVRTALSQADFWGGDLNTLPGMTRAVSLALKDIRSRGMRGAIENIFDS